MTVKVGGDIAGDVGVGIGVGVSGRNTGDAIVRESLIALADSIDPGRVRFGKASVTEVVADSEAIADTLLIDGGKSRVTDT